METEVVLILLMNIAIIIVITCFLLAGLSSLRRAMSCTRVELLNLIRTVLSFSLSDSPDENSSTEWELEVTTDLGWMTMELMLNSSWRSGSAVVLTSYSPRRTFRMSPIVRTKGRLKWARLETKKAGAYRKSGRYTNLILRPVSTTQFLCFSSTWNLGRMFGRIFGSIFFLLT